MVILFCNKGREGNSSVSLAAFVVKKNMPAFEQTENRNLAGHPNG